MQKLPLCSLLLAAALLTGCAAGAASAAQPAAQSAPSPAPSAAESAADTAALSAQLDELAAGDYAPLHSFVERNISAVPSALADRMALALFGASRQALTGANDYIYSEKGAAAQQAIRAAYPDGRAPSVISGADKTALLEKLDDGAVRSALRAWTEQGLALTSSEGSYYFVVDYPEYEALCSGYAGAEIREFLAIAAAETRQPLTNEEYLAVTPEELGRRAISYETFLAAHGDASCTSYVRILLNVAVYKLAHPAYSDGVLDNDGRVNTTMMSVYARLAGRDDCPVLQSICQGTLDAIRSQNGSIADGYDMSAFNEGADARTAGAQAQLDALYGALPADA